MNDGKDFNIALLDPDAIEIGTNNSTKGEYIADVNMFDTYSDIYNLYIYIINDHDFTKLKSDSDYTSVAIRHYPDITGLKILLGKMSEIFNKTDAVTNRKTNYLIFEFGINKLKKVLVRIFELKELILEINIFLRINNPHNLGIYEAFMTGHDVNKITLFLSPKQRDQLKMLKQKSGIKSQGAVAMICVAFALNATFKDEEKYRCLFSEDDKSFQLYKNYFADDGLILNINNHIHQHENDLEAYIKMSHQHLKHKLDNHNNTEEILKEKDAIYISSLLERMEKIVKMDDEIEN